MFDTILPYILRMFETISSNTLISVQNCIFGHPICWRIELYPNLYVQTFCYICLFGFEHFLMFGLLGLDLSTGVWPFRFRPHHLYCIYILWFLTSKSFWKFFLIGFFLIFLTTFTTIFFFLYQELHKKAMKDIHLVCYMDSNKMYKIKIKIGFERASNTLLLSLREDDFLLGFVIKKK